jgi:hypothetical protein
MEDCSSRFGGVTNVTRITVCLGALRVHSVSSLHSTPYHRARTASSAGTTTLSFFQYMSDALLPCGPCSRARCQILAAILGRPARLPL